MPGSALCQFGVNKRSDSQRSLRQEFATSERSSTTWSIERSVRRALTARPACPAPMMTTGTCVTGGATGRSADFDGNARGVRDHVEDRGTLLRLGDERLDVLR